MLYTFNTACIIKTIRSILCPLFPFMHSIAIAKGGLHILDCKQPIQLQAVLHNNHDHLTMSASKLQKGLYLPTSLFCFYYALHVLLFTFLQIIFLSPLVKAFLTCFFDIYSTSTLEDQQHLPVDALAFNALHFLYNRAISNIYGLMPHHQLQKVFQYLLLYYAFDVLLMYCFVCLCNLFLSPVCNAFFCFFFNISGNHGVS